MMRGTVTRWFTPSATGCQLKLMEACAGAEKALSFPAPAASSHNCFHAGSNGWGLGSHPDWGTEPANKLKTKPNKTKEDLFERDLHQCKCGNGDPDCLNVSMKSHPEGGQVILWRCPDIHLPMARLGEMNPSHPMATRRGRTLFS